VTDAELACRAVAPVLLRYDDERHWLRAAPSRVGHLFPRLLRQSEYNQRLRAAGPLMEAALRRLADQTPPSAEMLRLMDATPIPCGQSAVTARRSDLFGWAGYGYCPSHSRWYWGAKLIRQRPGPGRAADVIDPDLLAVRHRRRPAPPSRPGHSGWLGVRHDHIGVAGEARPHGRWIGRRGREVFHAAMAIWLCIRALQGLADGRHPVHLIVMERDGLDPITRRGTGTPHCSANTAYCCSVSSAGTPGTKNFTPSSSVIRILPEACQASLIRRPARSSRQLVQPLRRLGRAALQPLGFRLWGRPATFGPLPARAAAA
jgi:hypothetical protein